MKKTILGLLLLLTGFSAYAAERAVTVWEGEFYTDKQKNSGAWTNWANMLNLGPELWPQIAAGDRIVFHGHTREDATGATQLQIAYTDASNDYSWETLVDYADLNGTYTLEVNAQNVNIIRSGIIIKGQNAVLNKVVWHTNSEGGSTEITEGNFKVRGTKIYDAKNNEFVMRGVNYSWCWQRGNETSVIPAAKRIGCNTIRIQLGDGKKYHKPSAQELEYLITLCEQNKLVAMFNTHDETGSNDVEDLRRAVNFWIEMKDVLNRHTATTIVNISNEWFGQWNNAQGWADGYKEAIPALRKAGLKNMLVVDAAGYGQWPQSIFSKGAEVAATDTDKNTVFSIHFYQDAGGTDSKVRDNIDRALNIGIPVIVGEFAYRHQGHDIAYQTIMDYCQEKKVGWLVWSWTGNGGGTEECDMFGSYDDSQYKENGTRTVKGKNGIMETSVECSIYNKTPGGDEPIEPVDPIDPTPGDDDNLVLVGSFDFNPAADPNRWKDIIRIEESAFQNVNEKSIIRLIMSENNGAQMQFVVQLPPEYTWTQLCDYENIADSPYDLKIADIPLMSEKVSASEAITGLKFYGLSIKGQNFKLSRCEVYNPGTTGIENISGEATTFDFNQPFEIYTLTGRRVADMTPGTIYILRQGNIVTKHIAR
ncbi:MAG: glycoside hydrolase family 5 protein [Muribaculaceae bacterium]|nr:glycoside hydrolase family 5 protein [Muribaculaceae bacterium]